VPGKSEQLDFNLTYEIGRR